MKNRSIMIQGTGSHVGKSILVCALCRILKQDGYRVAPFKAQNMALNSFVTKDGKEMGRAQAAQAEAAGIEPMVEMNPILLKPTGDTGSQVVIMGKPIGNMTAREYYQKKGEFVSIIKEAYDKLRDQFDVIVIEGAGSPAEINLKDGDIVNMGMAELASAPVLLVTDIDRGGAFAWIVGTLALLTSDERARVKGIVFNKFRGDKGILKPGLDMLEGRINKPVVGVIPYIHDLSIDDEDSVSLEYSGVNERDQGSGVRGRNTGDKYLIPDPRPLTPF
ncbi:MAG: cobyric acid synthase, partial [Candidatus Brocadia sp.]